MTSVLPVPQASSSLAQWLYFIGKLHDKSIDLGLDRVKKVANRLALSKPSAMVFIVGGTNGKGTTCRVLEMILLSSNYRVGVYSSPHLVSYVERVRIQGKELCCEDHSKAFAYVEKGRDGTSLTYFEYGTLAALYLFSRKKLDVIILEVGLGGRLDATNIIDPDVAVITNIAIDHTDWLGTDRDSIAREKSGIFRRGLTPVIGDLVIPNSMLQIAKQLSIDLYQRGIDWDFNSNGKLWSWYDQSNYLLDLPLPSVPLENAALAVAALIVSHLKIQKEAVIRGLHQAKLPGRFQEVSQNPLIILDVAHNPNAAEYLAKELKQRLSSHRKFGRVYMIIGMLKDKDIKGTLAPLVHLVDEWYCVNLAVERGASAEMIGKYLKKSYFFQSVEYAWKRVIQISDPEDVIVVCGSFYTVADVIKLLKLEVLE